MPANPLIFKDAEKARDALLVSQKKEIAALYQQWADEIGERANYYAHKSTASSVVSERQMRELQKMMEETSRQVSNEVYNDITRNIHTVADSVVRCNDEWLASLGFNPGTVDAIFNYVPDDIVRNIVSGQIYDNGWSLSSRIWSDNEDTMKQAYQIVAGGVAQNKSMYEIVKDLEKYVSPSAAKPWNLRAPDGKKIYPKDVDYNAQRLGRTLVQHGYQQSFVATTQKNPFITDYIWISNGSRVCDFCMEMNGKHFPKDDLPLDHPNGMCTMVPNVADDLTGQLADWFNSEDGTYPEIDEFASNFGYTPLQAAKSFDKDEWLSSFAKNETSTFEKSYESIAKNLTEEEIESLVEYTADSYYSMNRSLRGLPIDDWQEEVPHNPKDIVNIKSAMSKASMPEDVVVTRSASWDSFETMANNLNIKTIAKNKDDYIGAVLQDNGFMSTSINYKGGYSNDMEYIIKVPEGAQAIYLENITYNEGEYELLLNAGTEFIVEDIDVVEHDFLGTIIKKVFLRVLN